MKAYLVDHNANQGGAFETSCASDAVLDEAHAAMADFFNAARPEEIVFGNNMTSLTFAISRIIARSWQPRYEIVVTRLDHDVNITPWLMAAAEAQLSEEENHGFCYMRTLEAELAEYAAQRDIYSSLANFYPTLLTALDPFLRSGELG